MEDWIGICELCGYKAVVKAYSRDAVSAAQSIHKKERKDCPGEILVVFKMADLVSGEY